MAPTPALRRWGWQAREAEVQRLEEVQRQHEAERQRWEEERRRQADDFRARQEEEERRLQLHRLRLEWRCVEFHIARTTGER